MIVTVKKSNNKMTKLLSLIVVVGIFVGYYYYMSAELKKDENKLDNKLKVEAKDLSKSKLSKKLEKIIYKEIESVIDLIGQEYIRKVVIVKDKVVIVTDITADIEAVSVRYGTLALIKKTTEDLKIAINLSYIVESKYDNKK